MRGHRRTRPPVISDDEMDADWCELDYAEQVAVVVVAGLGMVPPRFRNDFRSLAEEDDCCRVCKAQRYGGPASAALVMTMGA